MSRNKKIKSSKKTKIQPKNNNIMNIIKHPDNYGLNNKKIVGILTPFLTGFIVFYIIAIIWCSLIISYLRKVNSCTCYNDANNSNYSNIQYLIIIESFIIAIYSLITILLLYTIYFIKTSQSGGGTLCNNPLACIFSILLIIAYLYFGGVEYMKL